MAKRTKKLSKTLRLESLEQRQLLAGGFTTAQGQEFSDITHSNGNVYDQVLLKSSAITVTNDAGQITRVSFLDLNGDIVQAEFSGAGSLSISLDNYSGAAEAANYTQPDVKYVKGLASFTIQGSDATTNLSVFTVGTGTANNGANNPIFSDAAKQGGDHLADVARVTVVADPSNPNGSTFGGIRAGNAVFSADSGVVGVSAANVQIQNRVIIGDINAKGSATPTLVFGTASQFGDVYVAGGGLVSENGKPINNSNSYNFSLTLAAGTKSDGTADAAETTQSQLSFTGNNPVQAQTKIYELTGGVDTITGTTGNDTINGTNLTVTGLDSINGNGGTDSLIINDVDGTVGAGVNLGLLTVSNVENLSVNSVGGLRGDALNTSGWSGLTSETLTLNTAAVLTTVTAAKTTDLAVVNAGTGAITVVGGGDSLILQNGAGAILVGNSAVANNYTSASIKGGTTVGITDRTGASAAVGAVLTSVTLDGNTGLATLTSDGLTSVTLKNLAAATTIVNTKDHALTLEVNKVTGGTVTDAKATSVSVTSTGDSDTITLTAVAATSVTLNGGAGKLTLADVNLTKAETITITGSKDVKISATTDVAALKTVDASGATGPVTITPALAAGVVYTGGSGVDTITLGATTKAITTGAGDDVVAVATIGTGGSVDAGAGTDTLKMASGAAVTATGDTKFADKISGFEALDLGTFASASAEIKLNNLDAINSVTVNGIATGGTADVLTLSGLASGATLKITGATVDAGQDGYVLSVKDADESLTDSVNVIVSNVAGIATGSITAADVETVALTTDDTAKTASGITHAVSLTATSAKTITVGGDAGAALTFTGTKLTSLDASGITKGGLNWTAGALEAAATIKGSAGIDNITATAATKAVTIEAGDGANVITVSNDQANSVTTGKDGDTITLGDGANTVVSGAGVDTIVTGAGADTINAGAGDDLIASGSGLDMVTGGAGKDTFSISVPVNGDSYATITDAEAGDVIAFGIGGGTNTFAATKISLADTAAFQNYLNAATAAVVDETVGSEDSNFAWFQYGGNTYLVQDVSAEATFNNNADSVVKIQGLVDLSKATGFATGLLTIV